jgi:hypothetical protein
MSRFAGVILAATVLTLMPGAGADPSAGSFVIKPKPGGCAFIPPGGRPVHVANGGQYVQALPDGTRKIYSCHNSVLTQAL